MTHFYKLDVPVYISYADLIRLGIEILFILERFFCFHIKELRTIGYKYIGHSRLMTTPIKYTQFY
jgi:hypothetical protein